VDAAVVVVDAAAVDADAESRTSQAAVRIPIRYPGESLDPIVRRNNGA
jgi:hypothetical protein